MVDLTIYPKFAKRRKSTQDKIKAIIGKIETTAVAIDFLDIKASVPSATVEDVKDIIDVYPALAAKVSGVYPRSATAVHLVEQALGTPIRGSNLSAANSVCKAIIDQITKPRHEQFLRRSLAAYSSGGIVNCPQSILISKIYDDYGTFVRESDNGLVSAAGGYNEALLQSALINEGLIKDTDLYKTGTQSEGDLVVAHAGSPPKQMYVEVKSYRARERLLRGLQDIPHPTKIGVGFFVDPNEFNPSRTQTLIDSNALAIYMPDQTYAALAAASQSLKAKSQDRFYRKLSNFPSDMKLFSQAGSLPVW